MELFLEEFLVWAGLPADNSRFLLTQSEQETGAKTTSRFSYCSLKHSKRSEEMCGSNTGSLFVLPGRVPPPTVFGDDFVNFTQTQLAWITVVAGSTHSKSLWLCFFVNRRDRNSFQCRLQLWWFILRYHGNTTDHLPDRDDQDRDPVLPVCTDTRGAVSRAVLRYSRSILLERLVCLPVYCHVAAAGNADTPAHMCRYSHHTLAQCGQQHLWHVTDNNLKNHKSAQVSLSLHF